MTRQQKDRQIAWFKDQLAAALEQRREWIEKVTVDRQRIAELEGQAFNVTNLKDLEYLMEVAAAHLTLRSPFNDKWKERAKAYQLIFQRRIKDLEG